MQLPRNVVCDAPVGLQDVMPTLLDVAGIAPPAGITGLSVLPLIRGRSDNWREALHGEHAGCYEKADGMHYLVDSGTKYVWYSQTGQEHLFNLRADPHELHDLAQGPDGETLLGPWRHRLIARLRDRPEGFTDGDRLIPGRRHEELVPMERVA
jgi:arylsulfatase A-like enzyme